MDLGIAGKWAIVCGSSRGLGKACAEALAQEGVNVVVSGRNPADVTINNLLPERIDTDRQHYMAEQTATRENISYEAARVLQTESIAARRLGRPEEFGALCAFVCSDFAGFLSGQNFHVDGGSYPALV
jgi:NAD(P)-dependent dehydrogenase (short-subunit alcohol dehydrogenase family)